MRYRAALDDDADFTDVSAAAGAAEDAASLVAAVQAAANTADECQGGIGGKEPVHSLDGLLGNEVTSNSQ